MGQGDPFMDDEDPGDKPRWLFERRRGAQRSIRRRLARARTIPRKALTRETINIGRAMYPVIDHAIEDRPKTRGDCENTDDRPCPWVSCRHHLYLDVSPDTGSIKINFPELEPWELAETCSLDVADRGFVTLEEAGEIMNVTRERSRQIEVRALLKLSGSDVFRTLGIRSS